MPCFLQLPSPSRRCTVSRAQSTGAPLRAQPHRGPRVPGRVPVRAHPSCEAKSCPCLAALDRRSSYHLAMPHRHVAALDRQVLVSASSSPANGKRPCLCPFPNPAIMISPLPFLTVVLTLLLVGAQPLYPPVLPAVALPHAAVRGHHPSAAATSCSRRGQASAAFHQTCPVRTPHTHQPTRTQNRMGPSRTGSGRHTRSDGRPPH
jgi:hypothetical protein